jgi:beta-galactosidase
MIRESFNTGWTAGPAQTGFSAAMGSASLPPVTLPYDVVRDRRRSADVRRGGDTAYFPGGFFAYEKTFAVPEAYRDKTVALEFEGVYRDAVVFINGQFAAQRPSGYAEFLVDADPFLRHGQENTIRVECRVHEDSRWYTGGGIYRPVHLLVADLVHVAPNGVRVTTPDVDADRAVVAVATTLRNVSRETRSPRVTTRILDAAGTVVAESSTPVTVLPGGSEVARVRLPVRSPSLWSVDAPALYTVETAVTEGDRTLDEDRTVFGIRTLQVDSVSGLRVNGERVDLRGACIHHDTGLLGAATIARAEERRVEILKAAGFNAIRSSHNPISRSTLEACDRLGMLVMDELTDVWTKPKSPFDYAVVFPEWWERDMEAMVAKDFNHPSVVMYSIGNEIFEVGSSLGSQWGRRLAEKVRSLDDTRFVTNAINGMVAVADQLAALLAGESSGDESGASDINSLITSMGDTMAQLGASDLVTQATEESAAVLDVVGFNYADSRYVLDRDLFPHRVIVGTETFPGHIDELWRHVRENTHVIGDFTWTGWDYLGEVGVGRVDYPDESYVNSGFTGAYPWLTAWVGDIDITGVRRPQSYYRETVFGLRQVPYIAVHRPEHHGKATWRTPWAWTDTLSSWTWAVPDGSPVTVDVYSDAAEVELLLDGRSLGRSPVGQRKAFVARFEVTYAPGELVAVAYDGDTEVGRTSLRTATGPTRLTAAADREVLRADDGDLAYVALTFVDPTDVLVTNEERVLSVTVTGPGVLAGLGSGRPRTEEPFNGSQCTSFDGRAMAIVRPTGPGAIEVRVESDGCEPVTVGIRADEVPAGS